MMRDKLKKCGVYNEPKNEGVDEHTIWGDYFFLEALVRMSQYWNDEYWKF